MRGRHCSSVVAAIFLLFVGPRTASAQVVGRVPDGILSGNGLYIASNVSGPNQCGPLDNALLHNRATGGTECLGVATDGSVANAPVVVTSFNPAARFAVVQSRATNLDPRCSNGVQHVFLHDRLARTTHCVSYSSAFGQGNGSSFGGFVDDDGWSVAFTSDATNLGDPDTNGVSDVFVAYGGAVGYKWSRTLNGQEANGPSVACGISQSAVLFYSSASNLHPADTNAVGDLFVNGARVLHLSLVTTSSTGVSSDADTDCRGAGIRFSPAEGLSVVVFTSAATSLLGPGVDTNGVRDVFVRRLTLSGLGGVTRVSTGVGGVQANDESGGASVNADGRFVAFASRASNLIGDDTNGSRDVFVRDIMLLTTRRVSIAGDGTEGNGDSGVGPSPMPATSMSGDGRFVMFYSAAASLLPGGPTPGAVLAANRLGTYWLLTGAGEGGGPHVRGFDARGEGSLDLLDRFATGFQGIRLAFGDIDGDGAAEVVTAPGPSPSLTTITVWDRVLPTPVAFFNPYAGFRGGVYVAAGDIDGDGRAEIITGAGVGAGPHVRVLSTGNFSDLGGFFAYDPAFRGGVRVAAGDVDGDGRAEVITAPGPGGGPHVRVFKWNPTTFGFSELAGFFAYSPGFAGGVNVAAADINGDGRAEIVTGAGESGGPHVVAFDLRNLSAIVVAASFFAYDPGFSGGVRVGTGDWDGDGRAEIYTGPGPGGGPHVRVLKVVAGNVVTPLADFFAYDPAFAGGVYVAGPP